MVKAIIDIPKHTNKILTIFKIEHGLKDKSGAIEKMVHEYKRLTANTCPSCGTPYRQHKLRPGVAEELKMAARGGNFVKVEDLSQYFSQRDRK